MICFCKQIIEKVTRRNQKIFRFTVAKGEKETHNICGAMFRRGNFNVSGMSPYPEKLNVPPLPDLRKSGVQRGGMFHLAGLCPQHAIEFEYKLLNAMSLGSEGSSGDSNNSGDNSNDSVVVPAASSSSESTKEM